MKKKSKEKIQGVECPNCQQRLFSWSTHDYKTCGCPNETMIDGGRSYTRYGGMKMPKLVYHNIKIDGPVPVRKPPRDSFPY